MEFKTLKNIESSFRHLRLFSMLFLGACTLISVVAGSLNNRRVARWPWWHPAVLAAVGGVLVLSWVMRLAGLV